MSFSLSTRFIIRRSIGTRTVFPERIPLLEELLEPPVLKTHGMDQDAVVSLKDYVPPVLLSQMEASLSAEFRRHIVKTDWRRYEDPMEYSEYEQAARMLELTISTIKGTCSKFQGHPPANYGTDNEEWLRRECDRMLQEIRTGDTSRWDQVEVMVGKQWDFLSPLQREAVQPAAILLANNPHLHPSVKTRVLREIISVISKTIA